MNTPTSSRDDDHRREQLRQHYAAAASRAPAAAAVGDLSIPGQWNVFGSQLYADADRASVPRGAYGSSLACGNPTAVARLQPGDVVLDLGCGGGLDLLLSSKQVGSSGKVYGLDMTEEMLALARRNVREAGVSNVELLKGVIESIPLPAETVDVIISNCVVNLSSEKSTVFAEAHRVLRPGGRIAIADVLSVDEHEHPAEADCGSDIELLSGALTAREYRRILTSSGFTNVAISSMTEIDGCLYSAVILGRKTASKDPMGLIIDVMRSSDWPQVRKIYQQGIDTGDATLASTVPAWESWDAAHLEEARLIARTGDAVVGWAALTPVSSACEYRGVAEVSVYVSQDIRGHGVGRSLLTALIEAAEETGIWTLQAQMFPENTASLALHHRCGFRVVGVRERIGQVRGEWRDVVLLERRSMSTAVSEGQSRASGC